MPWQSWEQLSIREGRARACGKLQLCLSGEAQGARSPGWGIAGLGPRALGCQDSRGGRGIEV